MGRSGGTCHFCKNATENLAHLFYHCPLVNETLLFIKHKINLNVAETNYEEIYFDLKTMYFGLENQNKRISTFVNVILHIVKWELWKIKNLVKYENKACNTKSITDITTKKIRHYNQVLEKLNFAEKESQLLYLLARLN